MSRLEPLAPPYPEDVSKTFAKLMPPGMPPLALFRVVARNPRVLRRMQRGGLLDPGSIPLRLRELTILRTTARCGAGYELAVHAAFFGGAAGFTREDIEAAARGAVSDPRWSAQERLALALADALHDEGDVGDTLHAELARAFSPAQHVELVMLVGLYHAVSFLCRAFRLPPEAGTEALAQLAEAPTERGPRITTPASTVAPTVAAHIPVDSDSKGDSP
ncbi:MAG: carboxymuconolactone decarboxylase family protein [Myxococcota bacterium]